MSSGYQGQSRFSACWIWVSDRTSRNGVWEMIRNTGGLEVQGGVRCLRDGTQSNLRAGHRAEPGVDRKDGPGWGRHRNRDHQMLQRCWSKRTMPFQETGETTEGDSGLRGGCGAQGTKASDLGCGESGRLVSVAWSGKVMYRTVFSLHTSLGCTCYGPGMGTSILQIRIHLHLWSLILCICLAR